MELSSIPQKDELTLMEIESIIKQAHELGTVEITLFGGEPLMRDDIEDIIQTADANGMICSIDTNGLLLTPEKIKALIKAGLSAVKISLDSPESNEHDKMRGVPKCFNRAVAAVRECASQGLPCVVSTYASRENVHSGDLKKLIELARSNNATAVRIVDTTLSGCALSSEHKLLRSEDRELLADLLEPGFVFLENLASARKLRHPVCSALAKRYIYVSPAGDIQPCCFVPMSFGNLRKNSLKELLEKMWGSSMMNHDTNRCLMNNPKFREKAVPMIQQAEHLPVKVDSETEAAQ